MSGVPNVSNPGGSPAVPPDSNGKDGWMPRQEGDDQDTVVVPPADPDEIAKEFQKLTIGANPPPNPPV